jgi:hypothetical protein
VNKECCGRPYSSTDDGFVETAIQSFTKYLRKSVRQCCHETGVCKTSVRHILQCEKWKPQKVDMAKGKSVVPTPVS